ncbi:MAG: B12-binding domain-containing radical SAM protein [Desulfuromonadales bacterium]|nr:B12-binding domain-containing radical SAM protein [Desulfuromonadales bacterium]
MRTILATLHSKYIHASLALPCLAAYCGPQCGEILIREFTVHEPREATLAALLRDQPDVVAFSVYLWNRRETLDHIDALAAARPELRLVMGGPEVSFDGPELFASHPGLTALVRGEGELPLRALLSVWHAGREPDRIPRLTLRRGAELTEGPDGPPLGELDAIPSPFQAGLVDLERGLVYYETSRGCPFRCAFCLSARDEKVRTFSLARVFADLSLLIDREVPQIKLVDRTFNADPARAREIFRFILAHNRRSRFHFEIAAHLLDDQTLALLDQVPAGTFQFEIGVQSTLEAALRAVDRPVALERLEGAVRRLKKAGRIRLHLDLVAGLPGEGYGGFLAAIDRVAALQPDHLQVEPVKVLPGTPLREQAAAFGLRFDPNPPYTVLATPELSFTELERLRTISRLLDLTFNAGCFPTFLAELANTAGSLAHGLDHLAVDLAEHAWLRYPLGREGLFLRLTEAVSRQWAGKAGQQLRETLAIDLAKCERIVPERAQALFDTALTSEESTWVRDQVRQAADDLRGQGIKLQHFAAVFRHLPEAGEQANRSVGLFLYRTSSGTGLLVEERWLTGTTKSGQ